MVAKNLYGYCGRFARINLSSGRVSIENPPESYYRHYLGGRGFLAQILLSELPPRINPLGPENKLIFALGPMTGHPFMGGARNSVGAKSPLSGGLGEAEVGGYWGARLRKAGYDALIIEGAADNPVYISIDNEDIALHDASHLWGLEVSQTHEALLGELQGKFSTAIIGPGGEKLVRYACILNDLRNAAGRTGLGAVMGSKKLKAIAVRGQGGPPVADKQALRELARWMAQNYAERSHVCGYGTGAQIDTYEANGNLPIRNFQGGFFPGVKNLRPQLLFEKGYVESMDGCFGCAIRCKRRVRLTEPCLVEAIYGGPEYETIASLGSNCGIDDMEAIIVASEICNRFGIDVISTGVCISFAMECFESGLLSLEDTNGLELRFGNAQAMVKMCEMIARRRGLGDLLAEGSLRAARRIGKNAEKFAIQVKGEELPMHEPRYRQGLGLHFSVHFTGADHCTGPHDDAIKGNWDNWEGIDWAENILPNEMSPRKVRYVYQMGLWRHLPNYLGLCLFLPWKFTQIRDGLQAITGWPMSYWKMMKAVERGVTLARIFNLREGFTAQDDKLPARFFSPPKEGPLQGVAINHEHFAEAQKLYYQMMGWDESGVPSRARLAELDLDWASRYLPQNCET